jgi:hypothetical protein
VRPLFLMNHFITNPLASPSLAAAINYNPFLLDRSRRCEALATSSGRRLNFIAVDFWSLSHLSLVVRTLNMEHALRQEQYDPDRPMSMEKVADASAASRLTATTVGGCSWVGMAGSIQNGLQLSTLRRTRAAVGCNGIYQPRAS